MAKQTRREGAEHAQVHHRLAWFSAVQGLSILAVVMFATTNAFVSGALICGGIAMCAFAILATCCLGKSPRPMHLVFAIVWAALGAVYFLCV